MITKMQSNGHYLPEVNEQEAEINPNIFGSSSHGLGDTLLLTSICKYFPNKITIQIPESRERFACLFDKIAKVEITNDINVILDLEGTHYAERKLRNYFGEEASAMDIRPLVLYSDKDSELWAKNYLMDKPNPVIICPFVAKAWSQVRDIPENITKDIIKVSKDMGQTPIVIQDSDFDWGVETLKNLELKKLICLLRQVGFYKGANTGVYHLAVATGCLVECYQPRDSHLFNSAEWCYNHPTIKHYIW